MRTPRGARRRGHDAAQGGDVSRKKKLLQKQTEGKKRMKMIGRVSVPNEVRQASGAYAS